MGQDNKKKEVAEAKGWFPENCYGNIGYDAYAKSTGGKTYDGRDMPKWIDLPPNIKKAWEDAAEAIICLSKKKDLDEERMSY